MPAGHWKKSPPELVERFDAALPPHEGIVRRAMFGYAAAFVNGNLFCSLFQDRVVARLGAPEAAKLVTAKRADPFAPMPGRTMKEYVLVPPGDAQDAARLKPWLAKALAFGLTVKPKAKR